MPTQVVEVGRQALDRQVLLEEASTQMDAALDVVQTAQRVARMVLPAVAEGRLVHLADGVAVTLTAGGVRDLSPAAADGLGARSFGIQAAGARPAPGCGGVPVRPEMVTLPCFPRGLTDPRIRLGAGPRR